jgi:hypothetical protein
MNMDPWQPERPAELGRLFERIGRLGFWIQFVLLVLTVVFGLWVFSMRPASDAAAGVGMRNVLSFSSLAVLVFTTYWCRRYAAVGPRIASETERPTFARVKKMLWTGLWAGSLGAFLSLGLLIGAVGRMMFLMLANPQVGMMIAPAIGDQSISAIDALSMMALLLMLGAELIVVALTLWLLYRSTAQLRVAPAPRD